MDPYAVDWANPRGILLRQDAGPANPLGQVAIRFANPFSVYLHDTPSKPLFERAARAVSSGCVRVESALQLVDLLLEADERDTVARLLQSGETHEYRLARQTPILMAYWTADADDSGCPATARISTSAMRPCCGLWTRPAECAIRLTSTCSVRREFCYPPSEPRGLGVVFADHSTTTAAAGCLTTETV